MSAQLSIQSKNGDKKCTKHHLQDALIKKITLFANKINSMCKITY